MSSNANYPNFISIHYQNCVSLCDEPCSIEWMGYVCDKNWYTSSKYAKITIDVDDGANIFSINSHEPTHVGLLGTLDVSDWFDLVSDIFRNYIVICGIIQRTNLTSHLPMCACIPGRPLRRPYRWHFGSGAAALWGWFSLEPSGGSSPWLASRSSCCRMPGGSGNITSTWYSHH